ncbi:hypothetical protein FI667_g5844, partial [Globisporangium splendens]
MHRHLDSPFPRSLTAFDARALLLDDFCAPTGATAAGFLPKTHPTRVMRTPRQKEYTPIWDAIRVEHHGQYSIKRMQNFKRYLDSTSGVRTVAFAILAPLPGLLTVVISDLIPLEPPKSGLDVMV